MLFFSWEQYLTLIKHVCSYQVNCQGHSGYFSPFVFCGIPDVFFPISKDTQALEMHRAYKSDCMSI